MDNTIRVKLSTPDLSVDLSPGFNISQNYDDLTGRPKINGITLTGNKTSAELSILSDKTEEYPTVSLSSVRDTHYVIALGEENAKVPLAELSGTKITTVESIPDDMSVGDYIFLKQ